MTRIIGFEGLLDEEDIISYGAAAIELDGGETVNSVTRLRQKRTDLDEKVEALTLFAKPWDVDHEVDDAELIVLAIRSKDEPWYQELYPVSGRLGGFLGRKRAKPFVYLLFRDRLSFKQYADETSWKVANAILAEEWSGDAARSLLQTAQVLAPRNPMLLALRVHFSSNKLAARRTAERLLDGTSQAELDKFDSYLKACEQPPQALYLMKYEDGDQKIGGFNINVAVEQLQAIGNVTRRLRPVLRESLPFIVDDDKELPEFRFQHLKAASAELGFGVLGRNLRERVLRYLELEMFAKVFRGDVPAELAKDAIFAAEVHKILSPAGGATLRHQPIGATSLEPIAVDFEIESERLLRQQTLQMLGFVQGFYREVRRAEVRFADDYVVSVPIDDDGFGGTPSGTDPLRAGVGLFRPAAFTLVRSVFSNNRVRWHIQSMALLAEKESIEIDTIPSSIIARALFGPSKKIPVTQHGRTLRIGTTQIDMPSGGLDDARAWLRDWHIHALDIELSAALDFASNWYSAPSTSEHNSLRRIVIALGELEDKASIDLVIRQIDEMFNTRVRTNNTWRTIRDNPDLFSIDDDSISFSQRGKSWHAALWRYIHSAI